MTNPRKIKRDRLGTIQGQESINQIEHVADAGARLVYQGCLIPGDILTSDASAAAVLVKAGTILRIQVGSDTYVAFGGAALVAVDVNTTPGLKLPAGYHIVVATDDYMRTSANPTRVEMVRPQI